MNEDEIKRLAATWNVETVDISGRVAAAIGAPTSDDIECMTGIMSELGSEIRALRREIVEQRRAMSLLRDEVARMRAELHPRSVTRIAPFIATEAVVRLS